MESGSLWYGVTVEFNPLEKGVWIGKDFNQHQILPDALDTEYKSGFVRQLQAFAKLVSRRKKEWPAVDLEDSLKTVLLAERIIVNSK